MSALQLEEITAQAEVTRFSYRQDVAVKPQQASQTACQPLVSQLQRPWLAGVKGDAACLPADSGATRSFLSGAPAARSVLLQARATFTHMRPSGKDRTNSQVGDAAALQVTGAVRGGFGLKALLHTASLFPIL